jgi:ribosomal protein S24E
MEVPSLGISKDDLRAKLAELYKSEKDSVSVFGLRTHYGGGKTTGFALIYDSVESLKKFEPHYRLVRYGKATKVEKPSRQQRRSPNSSSDDDFVLMEFVNHRKTAKEQVQGITRNGKDQGREGEEGKVNAEIIKIYTMWGWEFWGFGIFCVGK